MAKLIRGKADERIASILEALEPFEEQHKSAEVSVYRQNPAAVRIRIVNPAFARMSRVKREALIWRFLRAAGDDAVSDITLLLLLTPD